MHDDGEPSAWIVRHAAEVATGGTVLDLACGSGRHVRWFRHRGHPVCAVDRDVAAVRELAAGDAGIEVLAADLEGADWPLGDRTFAAVVVTNYLWRPLLPRIVAAVATSGVLLYETFAVGNEQYGRPRNPEFLLREEHTVTECVDRIGLSQGRVSAHLACLADCGYVQVRRAGRFAHYRVADPRVADLVMLARSLAADNAAALAECVRISPDPAAETTPRP